MARRGRPVTIAFGSVFEAQDTSMHSSPDEHTAVVTGLGQDSYFYAAPLEKGELGLGGTLTRSNIHHMHHRRLSLRQMIKATGFTDDPTAKWRQHLEREAARKPRLLK